MVKLTIYIPSYNRSVSLLKQLKTINSLNNKSKIKIIINDNCSTDTKGYKRVKDYCLKNNFIYNKNQINIGADANIFNGFLNMYDSEYIWILSDDDLLNNSAMKNILNVLENNDLDILFFTHSKIDSLEIKKWNQRDFFENNIKTADGAGLISNVIYKVGFIKDSVPLGFQNIYTHFAHLAVLIHSLKNKIAEIGRVGSYIYFMPNTNLPPPEGMQGYDHSFFGFVLLGELFEENIKSDFINNWCNFWSLRHWHKKFKNGQPNSIYAKAYIKENLKSNNFFRLKLLFWKVFLPIFNIAKRNISTKNKKRVLKIFKVKF